MSTNLSVPEIYILPSEVPSGDAGRCLYRWQMKINADATLDSEDHGDDFDTIQDALAHAYGVFEDLVNTRHLYPSNAEQELKLRVLRA